VRCFVRLANKDKKISSRMCEFTFSSFFQRPVNVINRVDNVINDFGM
jgi:hypothetical protein